MNEAGVHMKGGVVYAIVGPSEAGKSTMLALIKVCYKPNHGHVLFNGIDISTLSSSYVRSLIGYIEHDAPTYSGSSRTNLAMNKNGVSDEGCWNALNKVNLTPK